MKFQTLFIDIPNDDDISDAISRTQVVSQKIQVIALLTFIHPFSNLTVLSDNFEFRESYIGSGSEPVNLHFCGNTNNPLGEVKGVILNCPFNGEVGHRPSSPVFPIANF